MINDVMGADDDDYGDYGDEKEGFKRENEANFDFMWAFKIKINWEIMWFIYNQKDKCLEKNIPYARTYFNFALI